MEDSCCWGVVEGFWTSSLSGWFKRRIGFFYLSDLCFSKFSVLLPLWFRFVKCLVWVWIIASLSARS